MTSCKRRTELAVIALAPLFWVLGGRAELEMELRDTIEADISKGGKTKIDEAIQQASTEELLQAIHELSGGKWAMDYAMLRKVLLGEIRSRPEHAKVVGDRIDRRANERGAVAFVDNDFRILEFVGSSEALEQLGRFLWDERIPQPKGLGNPDESAPSTELKARAAWSLCVVLGRRSPVQANAAEFYNGGVEKMQQWYKENEAKLKDWQGPVETGSRQLPRPPQERAGDVDTSERAKSYDDENSDTNWLLWLSRGLLGIGVLVLGTRWVNAGGGSKEGR